MTSKKIKMEHDGYAIIRRPLLPLQGLDRFYERYVEKNSFSSRELINALLDIPNVEAAVKLGAPGLIDRAHSDLPSKKLDSILVSLTKYLIRMATRCTPYSAFATVALGKIVAEAPVSKNAASCRLELDCGVLAQLASRIQKKMRFDKRAVVKLNPTAYRVQDEVRYFERTMAADRYEFSLAKISRSPHLDCLIDVLKTRPRSIEAAVKALCAFDEELSEQEYLEYIQELVRSSLLAVDADVKLTDAHPILNYITSLQHSLPDAGIEKELELLEAIATLLNPTSECSIADAVRRVDDVEAALAAADVQIVPGRVVHVDAFSSDCQFAAPPETLAALSTAVERLHALYPVKKDQKLSDFANDFEKRFGDRFVPLLNALDPETGLRFANSSSTAVWTKKLNLHSVSRQGDWDEDAALQGLMAKFLATQEHEIDLASFNVAPPPNAQPIASSFSINATFFGSATGDTGENRVLAHLHSGYSGSTNLIARFAARHPEMAEKMRASILRDARDYPEPIFAEIVHSPQPRMGNVLARPQVRDYEIVLSDQASVEPSRQIQLTELLVGVIEGQVVLWCTRLQRQVVPCLTSAYYFRSSKNIGLFQFLCHISRQGRGVANFRWPKSFDDITYLPRVVCGPIIVAAARWVIDKESLDKIAGHGAKEEWKDISELLAAKGMPRYFVVEQGDQRLEIDRDNWLGLSVFISMTKKLHKIHVRESTSRMGEPLFKDGKESWNSEVVLPLRIARSGATDNYQLSDRVAAAAIRSGTAYSDEDNGKDWCYYKIYGGEQQISALLAQKIFPEIENGLAKKLIEKWHFVRYTDPDFHFRIRVYGQVGAADAYLQSIITRWVMPSLRTYQISAVNREVYLPELVRYSGRACLRVIESIFSADSTYCAVVSAVADQESSDEWVWKGAFAGVVQYLNFLKGYSYEVRAFVKDQRDMFRMEMAMDPATFDKMGNDYRSRRTYIESCVRGEAPLHPQIAMALARRGEELRPLFEMLERAVIADNTNASLSELMRSIVHMQCNRLFVSSSRPQEYVIWDYLDRAFRSVGAKA